MKFIFGRLSIPVILILITINGYGQVPHPVHAGSIVNGAGGALLNNPTSIYVSGNYAYVVSSSNALEIVDITNPSTPVHKGSIVDGGGVAPFLNQPFYVYVSGNYAYIVTNGSNALEIVDVSNPAAPVHVGSLTNGTGGANLLYPNSVYVSGNYAYVASYGNNALEIVDISNPASPVHAGSLTSGTGGALLSGPISVYVSENYAYVVGNVNNALEIVNVTTPSAPVHAGSLTNGTGGALLNGLLKSVYVSGNYAYITNSNALEIVDVSNPASPVHAGSIIDGGGSAPFLSSPNSVYVSGNYAYLASDASNALEVIDISNPTSPVHAGSLTNGTGGALLGGATSVFTSGNYAYVASSTSNALEVVLLNPPAPTITSFSATSGTVGTGVTITGTNFYSPPTNNTISFNGVAATVTASTLTSITTIVPAGATTGKISVTLNGNTATSSSSFTVSPSVGQWVADNNGLYGGTVSAIAISGSNIFAGTGNGVFLSTNNGSSWTAANTGLTNTSVQSLVISGSNIFAGTYGGGIFLSTNNGSSWAEVNTGLTNPFVLSLAISGSNIFAGTLYGGVFLSTNNGTSWTAVNTGLTGTYVQSLAVSGSNIFAGTYGGGVFLSTNNGTSWTAVNTGMTSANVQCLAINGGNIFAGTDAGVFISTNTGTSWTAVNSGLTSTSVQSLAISGSNIFAGTGNDVFLSTNNGTSWTAVNSGLTSTSVQSLAISGSNIFAGTLYGGVFLSTNNGTSWAEVNTGLTSADVASIAINGSNIFAGTYGGGVFLSANNGTSWIAVNTGMTSANVQCLAINGSNIFAGTGNGVFLSTNNGSSWTAANTGLTNTSVQSLVISGSNIFAGTNGGGVFLSTNNGSSWTAVNSGLTNAYILSLVISGSNIFAGTNGGGVFLSNNNGTSWTAVNTGLIYPYIISLAISGSNIFAGTGGGGVFLSTNNGTSWTAVNNGLTNSNIHALTISGSNIFAGTNGGEVFLSVNNGTSWDAVNTGLTNTSIQSLTISSNNIFAGTFGSGVWSRPLSDFVLTPAITSFAPTSGPVGTTVTITGTNFDPTPANNIVFFGAAKANVTVASTTSLTVTVPAGATYQRLTVEVNGLVAYSGTPFSVAFLGVIASSAFSNKVDFGAGSGALTTAIGDLDGDGKPDIAVANYLGNSISVFRNISSTGTISAGSFAAKADFATGTNPQTVTIADLDGDGKPELICPNQFSNTVSVFKNISTPGSITTGSFATKVDFTTGSNPYYASVGDLDADGKPDIVVSNYNSLSISVFKNTSSSGTINGSSFASKVDFAVDSSPASCDIRDLDGDGKPDIAVANYGNSVSILRNTTLPGSINASSFSPKVDFIVGLGSFQIAVGDIDNDIKPDIIVANELNNSISILRNTSTSGTIVPGSFAAKVDFAVGPQPYNVALSDLDGDGKLDLAVANSGNSTISILKNVSSVGNISSGSFSAPVNFTTGSTPRFTSIGDLDGDGKAELVTANFNGNNISILSINSPTLTSFSPTSGSAGTTVVITGTNFDPVPGNNTVKFNGTLTTVTAGTTTSITTTVPLGATSGLIAVTVGGVTATSSSNFSVVTSAADSLALVALYNSTNGASWINKTNWLTGPVSTWYGVTLSGGVVVMLNLHGNKLSGSVPSQIGNLVNLTGLNLSNNSLTSLPNLSALSSLDSLKVGSNKFQFGDLEPNITVLGFTYAPQDTVDVVQSVLEQVNSNYTFTATLSGTANSYQWNKKGTTIPGATTATLAFPNITFADDATYTYSATNSIVTGLTLYSHKKVLRVSSLQRDSLALTALYNSTTGPGWTTKSNWTTTPLGTGNWFGVTITGNRVSQVSLPSNNLIGFVPTAFADIQNLTTVDLSTNKIQSLPDLSTLTNVTSLNVSTNHLDFASLIPNVSIPGINYSNQADLGNALDTLINYGTNYTVAVTTKGAGNLYQWTKNGGTVTGAIDTTYQITSINRGNMGTYVCQVTNPAVPSLMLQTNTQRVRAIATLSGNFVEPDSTAITKANILLLKVNPIGSYDTTFVKPIATDGTFILNKVVLDDYVVLGKPDTTAFPKTLPSYYKSTIFWEQADTLEVQGNRSGLTIVDVTKPSPPKGNGSISGTLEDDGTSVSGGRMYPTGGRVKAARRVAGAGVSASRAEGSGRTTGAGVLVAYTVTDQNGAFTLTGLPTGNFQLNIQYPGYPMDTTSFISFSIGSSPATNQVIVNATVSGNKIVVHLVKITGVEPDERFSVYPNPTKAAFNIDLNGTVDNVEFRISTVQGQPVKTGGLNPLGPNSIDVSALASGIYIVQLLQQGQTIKSFKIVKE